MRVYFEDRSFSARTTSIGRTVEIVSAVEQQGGIRHCAVLTNESLQRLLLICCTVESKFVDDSSAILPASRSRSVNISGRIHNHATIRLRSVISEGVQNLLRVLSGGAFDQLINDSEIVLATRYSRSVNVARAIHIGRAIGILSLSLRRESKERGHEKATGAIRLKLNH